jgi:hypothetical protein
MDEVNAREISKKYTHTVAAILDKDKNVVRVVWFDNFTKNSNEEWVAFFDVLDKVAEDNTLLGVRKNHKYSLPLHRFTILPMPDKQVFDWNGVTLIYERMPKRQWQKGVCSGNTRISCPYFESLLELLPRTNYFQRTDNPRIRYDLPTLQFLFETNHADSVQSAVADIEKYGLISRTLSNTYYLSLFPSETKPYVLFRFDIPVAWYNNKSDTFTVVNKVYHQEVMDFCNRSNLKSRIEV